MHRLACLVVVAACSSSSPSPRTSSPAKRCTAVASHVMAIGPVDRWIAEARTENMLPVDGASDREGLQRFFELACEENWEEAQRRCVVAQPTWSDVERECNDDKVWWYEPR